MGHPQVKWSVQLMTQNGGIPAQFQGDREGQKPVTTKSDGMWKFLKRHPRAQDAFTQWRQRLVDEAESQLWDCVQERQPWAVALVLKTLGKFRGYIEAKDLTPAGQSRLPQRDDGEDGDDEPWIAPRHRGEDVDGLEDADALEPSADVLRDLWGQQEVVMSK
jgi:hypothetical protein